MGIGRQVKQDYLTKQIAHEFRECAAKMTKIYYIVHYQYESHDYWKLRAQQVFHLIENWLNTEWWVDCIGVFYVQKIWVQRKLLKVKEIRGGLK